MRGPLDDLLRWLAAWATAYPALAAAVVLYAFLATLEVIR